ncbi:MAG: NAD(P)-dependent oxidoreductase [Sarcina sp.]
MSKNFKGNIQLDNFETAYIGLDYKKIRVGIIGGGKAGFLKAKRFILNRSYVEILSRDFLANIEELENDKVKLIKDEYHKSFICDKHLIIIAIDDKNLTQQIIDDCNEVFKIFIDCSGVENGIAKIPYQTKTESFSFAVSTKNANPKMSILLGGKINDLLREYDEFEKYTYKVRKKVKGRKDSREILSFLNTDEFKEIWKKNKADLTLKLFYDDFE